MIIWISVWHYWYIAELEILQHLHTCVTIGTTTAFTDVACTECEILDTRGGKDARELVQPLTLTTNVPTNITRLSSMEIMVLGISVRAATSSSTSIRRRPGTRQSWTTLLWKSGGFSWSILASSMQHQLYTTIDILISLNDLSLLPTYVVTLTNMLSSKSSVHLLLWAML